WRRLCPFPCRTRWPRERFPATRPRRIADRTSLRDAQMLARLLRAPAQELSVRVSPNHLATLLDLLDRRVPTRRISSDEGGRAAEAVRSFWRTVRRRGVVGPQNRPLLCRCNRLLAERQYGRNVRCFVDRLVEDRAVEPDNLLDVVLDFGGIE